MENKRFPEIWEDAVNFLPNGSRASYKYDENYSTIFEESARLMAERYESEIASLQKRIEELEAALSELRTIYINNLDSSGMPNTPLLEMLTCWDNVNKLLNDN